MQAISDKSFKDRLGEYLLEACTSFKLPLIIN